jgi:hypothetical protein
MSDERSNQYSNFNKKSAYEINSNINSGNKTTTGIDYDECAYQDLDNKLASIDNIISNCHGMMAKNPESEPTATNSNTNKSRFTRDLNDELSDIDEFELTKSLRES